MTCRVALLVLALAGGGGCARQHGLKSPNVERVALTGVNVVRSSKDVVHARCTKGKLTWDDGSAFDPLDETKYARCCTVYKRWRRRPFTIWISQGEEECWVHELCHVEQYQSGHPDHAKCHDFGLGRPKKRL